MQDWKLMADLERVAIERYDGHFAVLRFTANWRVCFTTPETSMFDGSVSGMAVGATFAAAALTALAIEADNPGQWYDRLEKAATEALAENHATWGRLSNSI